jgi:hypothetical protein
MVDCSICKAEFICTIETKDMAAANSAVRSQEDEKTDEHVVTTARSVSGARQ